MNSVLWALQIIAALLYASSGFMKTFMLPKIREGVRSFDALPSRVWAVLGILEMLCAVGLILPAALVWHPEFTGFAAMALAFESIVFIYVHVKFREIIPLIMSAVLGLVMTFIACGRMV